MNRLRTALAPISAAACALSVPAVAQDHSMHAMPGMDMPAPPKSPAKKAPAPPEPVADHGAMDHSAMPVQDATVGHAGMVMTGTALPAGNAPPPPVPTDHYAARQFPPADMARAHAAMMKESGGQNFGAAIVDIAEFRVHRGRDGFRWDGEAWYGGDLNRVWFKSEGEGQLGQGLEAGEVQLLYSRAIDPYFNLQGGVRQDIGPKPRRTYAVLAIEGLAPGMFEVQGSVFLSTKGEVLGRLEGYHDLRITQRLILQPRVELALSAQDIAEKAIGAGLTDLELGLRLRYELSRQFAPYIGVSHDRKLGDTARYARTLGEAAHTTSLVAGARFWF